MATTSLALRNWAALSSLSRPVGTSSLVFGPILSAILVCLCLPCPALHAQSNEWNWVGGANMFWDPGYGPCFANYACGNAGSYGILGQTAPGSLPGGRENGVTWTDANGYLWLFGGYGEANFVNSVEYLNDLWRFDPTTREWEWVSGTNQLIGSARQPGCILQSSSGRLNTCGQAGSYGTLGVPASGNTPGGREFAAGWIDQKGDFWLFGGSGIDGAANLGDLNDLWRFDPSSELWTWMGGSGAVIVDGYINLGQPGSYGTMGVAAPGNTPGARVSAMNWSDNNGMLWLFGGNGTDGNGDEGYLNDLWMFNPSTGWWAWMGGSSSIQDPHCEIGVNVCGQPGSYGTQGSPDARNIPGARSGGSSTRDSNGKIWLFGGYGFDSQHDIGFMNDLWEFDPVHNMWTWMGGSAQSGCSANPPNPTGYCGPAGVYGQIGVAAAGNIPSGRNQAVLWPDGSGNIWLFGGTGDPMTFWEIDLSSGKGLMSDFWKFDPSANEWTWEGGASSPGHLTDSYGAKGVPASTNYPGGRYRSNNWTDAKGNLWMLAGWGPDSTGTWYGYLNDLWEYKLSQDPWLAASPIFNPAPGLYHYAQTVSISDAMPGATIYYTKDGSTPTTASSVYTSPITVSSLQTFEAVATVPQYSVSGPSGGTYTFQVSTPVINPAGGVFTTPQTVTMTDATQGAQIYYTTDGSTPSASNGFLYTAPITVSTTETIYAVAGMTGWQNSFSANANFLLQLPTAAIPTFKPSGGYYTAPQSVTLSDGTSGAVIYYTTDGSLPAISSTKYTKAISVGSTTTISALAVASGYNNSPVATAAYTITLPTAATPTFKPAGGAYTSVQSVTLSSATTGASIYYTLDGSTPSVTHGAKYASAISVKTTETINAVAVANNYNNSAVAAATYTINLPQTITFAQPKSPVTYGTKPITLTATSNSGLPVTLSLVSGPATLNGSTLTFTGAGNVVVAAGQAGNSSYQAAAQVTRTIAVNKAALTATAANLSMTYGGTVPALSYALTGFVNGDAQASATTGAPALSTTAGTAPKAGSYPITIKAGTLAAANYTISYVNGTLTVGKVALTASAQNASKTYGAALPAFTYTLTGFLNGDTQATATTGAAKLTTTATTASAAGTYPIAIAAGTLASPNYTVTYVPATLTIGQAPLQVNANSLTKIYGAANPALTYVLKGLVNSDTAAKAVTGAPALSTTATASSPVASYPINIAAGTLASKNYTLQFTGSTLAVTAAKLTVKANNLSMKHGAAVPALTYAMTGLVAGDTQQSATTGAPALTTTATSQSAAGSYPITATAGTLASANYAFTFVSGTMTVTK